MKYCKLDALCRIQYGFPFDSMLFNDEKGTPLVRIRDVVRGVSETYTTETAKSEYLIQKDDILIGMDGEFNVAKWKSGPAFLNQRVCKIIPIQDTDKDYLFHFLPVALKRIEEATPFVTVKHLSAKALSSIIVPFPEARSRTQISSTLNTIHDLLELRKYQLKKIGQLASSRFVEMFGDPVRNPKGWKQMSLDSLGELNRGVSKARPRNAADLLGGPYPLVQTGEVSNANTYITHYESTYTEKGLAQSRMWPKGTLCITIAANIAQTAILTFDACFPDSVVGFIANERTKHLFIHYWFSFFQKILEEQAPQVAQKNINLKILKDLQVIVPPLSLQNKFVTFAEQLDKSKVVGKMQRISLEKIAHSDILSWRLSVL